MNDLIRNWILNCLSLNGYDVPVLIMPLRGPSPNYDFICFQIESNSKIGRFKNKGKVDDSSERIVERSGEIRLFVFSQDIALSETICDFVDSDLSLDSLLNSGLTVYASSPIVKTEKSLIAEVGEFFTFTISFRFSKVLVEDFTALEGANLTEV
jgi:hypothetical protein